ncbi:MAG: Cd(II)/Pb(II)-responsive transcriptional regulator [Burkholderiales bacterium]
MKIGELAATTDTPVDTIRYYEREGLIGAPNRTAANYRAYSPGHVERLRFIRHCRSLDMSLTEVRALLRFRDAPGQNCAGVNTVLDDHIAHVERRMADLSSLHTQLRRLRAQCRKEARAEQCGILWSLVHQTPNAQERPAGHIAGAHASARPVRRAHRA